jgi:hypothetical protein
MSEVNSSPASTADVAFNCHEILSVLGEVLRMQYYVAIAQFDIREVVKPLKPMPV